MENDPSTWAPANHVKDPNEAPDSWPTPATAATWGINKHIEDLSPGISFSFCNSASQISNEIS